MADEPAKSPFWKAALLLWLLALGSALAILPYISSLEGKVLSAAAERRHLPVAALLALSMVQTAILLAAAIGAGLWASRELGLRTPLIDAAVLRQPVPKGTGRTLALALGCGLLTGAALAATDRWIFASVAAPLQASVGAHPVAWQGFLASFYGAIDEEILWRLGVMSVLALGLRALLRADGLPGAVFWIANIAAAVLFGLAHLPATATLAPLTPALVVRAIVLNGAAGVVFGALFRRYGLEWAMVAHCGVDLVLHVALA
jgi:hypothetical protein